MTEPIREMSPRWKARIAGVLYFINGTAYTFADGSVRAKLVVSGDAGATAHNILANQPLYLLGFSAEIVATLCYVAVTLILYDLFRPVSRSVSLLAACFSLVGCAIMTFGSLLHLAPLVVLGNEHSLSGFDLGQLQALALLFLKMHDQIINVFGAFFGWYCLLIGYLIFRSRFMPRLLGVFMAISGLSYQLFLSPPLAHDLFHSVIFPAGVLGEGSLILWLLVVGVNAQRWREQAGRAVA